MRIQVKAKPGSRKEFVKKVGKKNFVVAVKEAPIKGKANKAILKALAEYFKVSSTQVLIVSGFGSRNKVFEVL